MLSSRTRLDSSTKMAVNGSWLRGRSGAQRGRGKSDGRLLSSIGQSALRLRPGELISTCESSCFASGLTKVRRRSRPGSDSNCASQPVEDRPQVRAPWKVWVVSACLPQSASDLRPSPRRLRGCPICGSYALDAHVIEDGDCVGQAEQSGPQTIDELSCQRPASTRARTHTS